MPTGRRMSARAMACVGTRLGEVPPSMVPMLTVTRCRVSASPAPDSGSEMGLARAIASLTIGRRLERQPPRGPSAGRARCAAGRWRWRRLMDMGAVRRRRRSPRPRPTSGPSRRSARPWASRRRRRCWRRPARAARAPACSRCRASPCSPRRRPSVSTISPAQASRCSREQRGGQQRAGHAALHVGDAAAVELAVLQHAAQRRHGPGQRPRAAGRCRDGR